MVIKMNKKTMYLKRQIIENLKLTLDEISALPDNACVRVNNICYSNICTYALHQKIKDPNFWNIISKYENYERTLYKLGHQKTIVHRYILMTKEDVQYLFTQVNYKPTSITAFLESKYTKEELEEQYNLIYKKYEEKLSKQEEQEKQKLLNLN